MYGTLGSVVAGLLIILIVLWLLGLGTLKPASNDKITPIIQKSIDTIRVLDTVLQTKIKTIKQAPDTVIVERFDSVFIKGPTDTVLTKITIGQERQCLACKDSLNYYKDRSKIDSATLDSISKIVKEAQQTVDTKKACSIKEQAQSFGLGTLFGITLRSFF